MKMFFIIWFVVSILSGLFLNIKVNGEYIKGFKRFVIAFLIGFPFALIMTLFTFLFFPLIIIIFIILIIAGIAKLFV